MSPHGLNKRFIREKFVVSRLNLILNLDVFFTDYHLKKKKQGKPKNALRRYKIISEKKLLFLKRNKVS